MSDPAHLQPPSAGPLQRQLSLAMARCTDLAVPIRAEWSADDCPAPLLPWLAWAFGAEEWDSNWGTWRQRQAVRTALATKRAKGTIGAVRDAVRVLGMELRIREWHTQHPLGDPYTYAVTLTIDQDGADRAQFQRLLALIDRTKNVRSAMSSLRFITETQGGLIAGGVSQTGTDLVIDASGTLPT